MKCYKEKGLIIFDFENGKRATYDMNTGEAIGKMGKPVRDLSSALSGYSAREILDSFDDKKYRDFLIYVNDNLTPHKYTWRTGEYSSRVKNLGTLLRYANDYKVLEQYFIAGIKANNYIRTPLKDVPKGLLKLCRKYDFEITDILIHAYNKLPNEFNVAFSMEFENISYGSLLQVMLSLASTYSDSNRLLTDFKYNLKAFLRYLDYLATFEGINVNSGIVREIADYANMMSQISDKYKKYPRYFLSTHRIAARNYERLRREFSDQLFVKRIKPEYEITCGNYKFFYPRSTQEIKDEAVQQQNCVASYIDRVIDGGCDILFLRKKDEPSKSVVTIEVRNGKIVQAFQAYNTPCNEEQKVAIDAFNKRFGGKG